jgi:Alw26I/Eco31I/Esp3I family type II restriction endonuclease
VETVTYFTAKPIKKKPVKKKTVKKKPKEKRQIRNWHNDFIKYTKTIAENPTYQDMPELYKQDGCVRWITAASSVLGKKRLKWWHDKRNQLGIPPEKGSLQKTAHGIHPTGDKPCQICGRVLSLDYVYLNQAILKKIHDIPNLETRFSTTDHIEEVVKAICQELGKEGLSNLKKALKITKETTNMNTSTNISNYIVKYKSTLLGPGVMSDAPDRLDGYHTYNRCCRHIHDKGRHKDNLSRYGEDRRVFQFWSEGDWKAADRLMKVFSKYGISPDHVGPISLGFCHRPSFDPTTLKDNINKRNRLGLEDIKKLLTDEKTEKVVSWHSKKVWDKIKDSVTTEEHANELGKVMRKNVNQVLFLLHKIKEEGHAKFLEENYLHPEYGEYDIEFEGFDPETGKYEKMKKTKGSKKQYKNNSERYVKKSLEFLDKYKNKSNRRIKSWKDDILENQEKELLEFLNQQNYKKALEMITSITCRLATLAEKEYNQNI